MVEIIPEIFVANGDEFGHILGRQFNDLKINRIIAKIKPDDLENLNKFKISLKFCILGRLHF